MPTKPPDLIKYTTYLTRDLRKALKVQAALEERDMSAVMRQALEEYLVRAKERPKESRKG